MTPVLRVGSGLEGVDQVPAALAAELADWETVSAAVGPSCGQARTIVARRAKQLAVALAAETGAEVHVVDGSTVRVVHPPEPTPWATGLTLSAVSAAVAALGLVVLTRGVAQVSAVLAVAANVVVVGGLAPSAWLARGVPVWRWVALGAAVGTVLAWGWLGLYAVV